MNTHPQNAEEFMARFSENQKITGQGIEGTTVHFPCPFCGASDFIVAPVLEIEPALLRDHKCAECERAGRSLIDYSNGAVTLEFVQTDGNAAPSYLVPGFRYLRLPQYG